MVVINRCSMCGDICPDFSEYCDSCNMMLDNDMWIDDYYDAWDKEDIEDEEF